jgi:hypothetical protein
VLSPLDDYPLHQTAEPVAHPASGDPNHYDRYFFNGYDPEGAFFFAAALGVYPNRRVIDGAFSVLRDGVQRCVYASGRAPLDRRHTQVGPLRVEVEEPLRRLRLVVDAEDAGLGADLLFTARTPAVEEPRVRMHSGVQLRSDVTRLTQWGSWSGSFSAGGERVVCAPGGAVPGTRDRSWGVRPVGEPMGGAPGAPPQFFWLWAPLHFEDRCTHVALNDDGEGRRWYESATVVPVLSGTGAAVYGEGLGVEHLRGADHSVDWARGTRRAERARLALLGWGGEREELELVPLLTFQMKGIGYLHPEWGHGRWHGEAATGGEVFDVAGLDPLALPNLHVQQLCQVTAGHRRGVGVLEQLVIGPHAPSGLTGLLDGAP